MSSKEERKEELLRKLEKDPEVLEGFVAASEADVSKAIEWQKATTITEGGVSRLKSQPEVVEFDKPDPIVKRAPQERLEALTRKLLDQMEDSMKVYGEPRIPEDIMDEIRALYAKNGRIDQAADVTVENLRAVAARFLQEAERKAT